MKHARALLGLACLALASCDDPFAACAADVSLLGEWAYEAVPGASHPYLLRGTLRITGESCEGFEGRADLLETDQIGAVHPRVGAVTGRLLNPGSLRFDAIFATGVRQHLAELRADSIVGSFVDDGAHSGSFSTGDFTLLRRSKQ